jgi:hypothetical protein
MAMNVPALPERLRRIGQRTVPVSGQLGRAARLATQLGWIVAGLGVATWFVAWRLGWNEFATVAAGCALALAVSALFMLGRDRINVLIELTPPRVVVGEPATGRIAATNATGRRILPFRIEAPVGANYVRADVPSLAAQASHEELFVIPTSRRGVIGVGPASSVRGDPLGLMRREVAFTNRLDLYVHPKTVSLAGLATGWIRDLEGMTTNDLSPSDVELHTLREYVPGDDRRHVHWRTSARAGTLMVRQYVDTRRSHLMIVLSTAASEYASDDEFELAVSISGSLGVRALRDDQELTCIAGNVPIHAPSSDVLLDGLAGVEFGRGPSDLAATVIEAVHAATTASVVTIVTGSRTDIPSLRLAAKWFPADLRVIAFRSTLDGRSSYRPAGNTTVLDVAGLDDLERLLRAAGGL